MTNEQIAPDILDKILAALSQDGNTTTFHRFPSTLFSDTTSLPSTAIAATLCQITAISEDEQTLTNTNAVVLRPAQRLVALFIIAHCHPQLSSNPYLPLLLHRLDALDQHAQLFSSANNSNQDQPVPAAIAALDLDERRVERAFILLLLVADSSSAASSASPPVLGLPASFHLDQFTPKKFQEYIQNEIQTLHQHANTATSSSMAWLLQSVTTPSLASVLLPVRSQALSLARRRSSTASSSSASLPSPLTAELTIPISPLLPQQLPWLATVASSSSSSSTSTSHTLHLSVPPPAVYSTSSSIIDVEWQSLADDFDAEVGWMHWNPPANLIYDPTITPPYLLATASDSLTSHSNNSLSIPTSSNSAHSPSSPSTASLTPNTLSHPIVSLLSKALKSLLPIPERTQLLAELKGAAATTDDSSPAQLEPSPALSAAIQLIPPNKLSQLVDKNHEVARAFLLQYMNLSLRRAAAAADKTNPSSLNLTPLPHTINDYLSAVVQMEMSLPSMELVKDLALVDSVILPADFLHLYICKCLSSCSKLQDKVLQNRHVRLICVFLLALIRHKIIQMPTTTTHTTIAPTTTTTATSTATDAASAATTAADASTSSSSAAPPPSSSSLSDVRDVLLVEVQSFLVEFARIKEAANLFKLLKNMEANT